MRIKNREKNVLRSTKLWQLVVFVPGVGQLKTVLTKKEEKERASKIKTRNEQEPTREGKREEKTRGEKPGTS